MSNLKIEFTDGRRAWYPGEILTGEVSWQLDSNPDDAKIILYWHTSGKGTQNNEIIRSIKLDAVNANGGCNFEIQLPLGPYSFDGKLISLEWGVELKVGNKKTSEVFSISTDGLPVDI